MSVGRGKLIHVFIDLVMQRVVDGNFLKAGHTVYHHML